MKLTKSRDVYKCEECENPINKGDMYLKKSKSIGSPGKMTHEARFTDKGERYPVQVMHGVRFTVRYCERCASSV